MSSQGESTYKNAYENHDVGFDNKSNAETRITVSPRGSIANGGRKKQKGQSAGIVIEM